MIYQMSLHEASAHQELQHAQRLERLRDEQRQAQDHVTQKMQFEQKYEPCVVCGDRASGWREGLYSLSLSFSFFFLPFSLALFFFSLLV